MSALAICLIAALTLIPSAARAQGPSITRPNAVACDQVGLSAEQMTCDRAICQLRGEAHITCSDLDIWADEIDITLGESQSFAGAEARGQVLVVDSETVLTCRRLILGPDRIQGRIEAATFHIKRDPTKRDERGVPNGRDRMVLAGEVERNDAKNLHVKNASFTMCDCGDDPPSWVLDAHEIDATLGERATLWWPRVRFNAFGLGLIPGPPLLPLSLPLGSRAAGMLPPEIAFLGGVWPTVDFPVFFPLGRSWDLTVAPGMRFDWGRHQVTPPSTWGAPRLGARVRYAPHSSSKGEIRVQWTGDLKRRAARRFAEQNGLPTSPAAIEEAIAERASEGGVSSLQLAQLLARRDLQHRVSLELDHRTEVSDELTWLVAAEWLSDDLITQDFRVTLDEQAANYVPSRTQLLWRHPWVTGTLAADYLLALNNSDREVGGVGSGKWDVDYSNVGGRERGTAHRGPHVRLTLPSRPLAGRLHADADLAFVRYGPWVSGLPVTRSLASGIFGLSFLDTLGPVQLAARAGLDGLWITPVEKNLRVNALQAMATLEGEAGIRLARFYGNLIHVIDPRLTLLALPYVSDLPPQSPAVDPRLERTKHYQGLAVLEQSLWRRSQTGARKLGALSVRQPFDLETGDVLQTQVQAAMSWDGMTTSAWADVDFTRRAAFQEIGAELTSRWGPVSASGKYARWTPRADRFRRTLYELAASSDTPGTKRRVHVLGASVDLRLGQRVGLSYGTHILLPIEQPVEQLIERDNGPTEHRVRASYRSPCDCWEVSLSGSIPTRDPLENLRVQFLLSVGGYALGN